MQAFNETSGAPFASRATSPVERKPYISVSWKRWLDFNGFR